MSYYRRKLFGNIIANIDIRYRFKYNGNVSYPRGIMGLPYYENEIQKLGLVQKGIYSYNLTMTENDVDIVNVPIYRWDDNNDVGVWRGRIARVKEK